MKRVYGLKRKLSFYILVFSLSSFTGIGSVDARGRKLLKSVSVTNDNDSVTITMTTSGRPSVKVVEIKQPHRIFIDFIGAELNPSLDGKRMQIDSRFASMVLIEQYDEGIIGSSSRVTVHLKANVRIEKKRISKNQFEVSIYPEGDGGATSKPVSKVAPPGGQKTALDSAPSKGRAKAGKGGGTAAMGKTVPAEKTAGVFTSIPKQVSLAKKGERVLLPTMRIDLDFKDADIHNILRLLSDIGHINLVVGDDVKGKVTLRMRNVPWNLALDVLLEAKGLGKVKVSDNIYRIAPKSTLEKERQMRIKELQHKKILKPLITKIIPVSYAMAKEVKPQASELLSSRGSIGIDERTNVLIVRDVVENLSLIEQLVRNLDTQTPQVLIEARIVESTSTYNREIGIQWGGHFIASSSIGNPTGIVFPNSIVAAGGGQDDQTPTAGMNPFGTTPNPNFAVNLPAMVGTGTGGAVGISFGSVNNSANLNLRLSALENEGVLKIISAPKILTLDNKQAKIEQGTLIPYSQISAQGVQTAFQEAKLSLTVTPHVTAEGSILMRLVITRDEPDFNNRGARGDPTILKRHAETELLIKDGKTAVIGGIYTRNYGRSYNQIPFFAKIPVLGWLFKKRTDTDRRTELLIFITPRIVNRAEALGR